MEIHNMAYLIELDVSHEAAHEEVVQLAHDQGCTVLSKMEHGPAGGNPSYTFAADSKQKLIGLAQEINGITLDEEWIKTKIIDVAESIGRIHA